jgi:glutathione S-transferase
MMKLTASQGSPFVRKVRITIALKDIGAQIEQVTDDTNAALNKQIRGKNPLHKIPTLMLEDGSVIYDSHVICEYLDALKPQPRLFPAEIGPRIKMLTLAALADGVMEAAILVAYEARFRPKEKWVQEWLDHQQSKVDAGLDWLEANVPVMGAAPDYSHVTLACALGYLDWRQEGRWRAKHPKLVAWLDKFSAAVPAFRATERKS